MKKTVLVMIVILTLFSCVSEERAVKYKAYVKYKEWVIKDIKDTLESNDSNKVFDGGQNYISGVHNLYHERARYTNEGIERDYWIKMYEIWLKDMSSVLSEYSDAMFEHDASVVLAQGFKQVARERLYEEAIKKYSKDFPIRFEDLTAEQKSKIIANITGGRNMFKSEWDTLVQQYHVQAGRSRAKVYENGSGKSEVTNALDWLIAQEALWNLGYIGRFTNNYEYSTKLKEFENIRMNIILYSEEKGLWK